VLLILTGSGDGTVDRIIHQSSLPVFRLNLDLFSDYQISYSPNYWKITDPTGRSISSENATRVFWWKAFSYGLNQESFLHEELKYLFRELYSWFGFRNQIIGNPPDTEHRIGKVRQLEIAQNYFQVPQTQLLINSPFPPASENGHIVKSFTSGLTTSSKAMFTQEVSLNSLDNAIPWYVQEKIDSTEDITVMVAGDNLYAYSRSRSNLVGLDWRAEQFSDDTRWIPITLKSNEITSIENYCRDLGVSWGRIDFMFSKGDLYFLEINLNVQCAFLDIENNHGLIAAVVKYIETGRTHSQLNLR
jgi:hypothetical protein